MRSALPTIAPATLELAKAGDAAAQADLYAAFAPLVFTLARRMLASRELAEDALQETFVEIIRKLGSYRGESELAFWIRRIAINRCLMQLRSPWSRRRVEREHFDAEEATLLPGADDRIELERALDRLPAVARAVVWLHDVEGLTHGEIGKLMGRTPSFSKSQLARAHERLRALLGEANETSEGLICGSALKTC